ncbi:MAG: lysostaphin resistance A-like protein [Bacteroidia bacterium]
METQNIFKLISRLLIAFGVMFINLFLFTVLAQFICQAVYHVDISGYIGAGNYTTPKPNELSATRLFFCIYSIGTFVFSSFILALIFKQKPTEYLGLNSFPKPIYLIIVPVLLIVCMPFLSWLVQLNAQLELPTFLSGLEKTLKAAEDQNNNLYKLMLGMSSYIDLFINILVMALIPAIGEELFCRGVLLNLVYDYSGKILKSIVVVAIIFTLFHLQFYKFMPMMVLAVMLGLFINWTQSIWASILFHFLNNTLAVVGSFYSQRGVKNFMTDENFQMPYLLTILSFVLTIALIAWLNKFAKQNTKVIYE